MNTIQIKEAHNTVQNFIKRGVNISVNKVKNQSIDNISILKRFRK